MPIFLRRDLTQETIELLLILVGIDRRGCPVRFVDNYELRTIEQEEMAVAVVLDEIDARHLNRIMPIDALRVRLSPVQLTDRAGADDDRVEIGLFPQFLLPLVAKVGRAKHAQAFDLAAVEHLASD